jgi:acyl CoA:acetate/3-ketoacid CoA transferase beta subunit
LRGRANSDAWLDDLDPSALEALERRVDYNGIEMMIVTGSRLVMDKARDSGYSIIVAGVGHANLTAWLAASKLQVDEGLSIELVAEIGLFGYVPKPGEAYIFSNRNLPSCKSLTGVETILGFHVSGRQSNCLALVGAGQIDPLGNINSTYDNDGGFLVGSGGANDIASAANEVIAVMQQSKRRLVPTLPYITSPGLNVSTLVTDLGTYEKRNGSFVLTHYFPINGKTEHEVVDLIRSSCGWELILDENLVEQQVPRQDELVRLRLYDFRNDFLGVG